MLGSIEVPLEVKTGLGAIKSPKPDVAVAIKEIQAGNFQAALNYLKPLLDEGENVLVAINYAAAAHGTGETQLAKEVLEKSIRECPENPLPYLYLSKYHEISDEPLMAVEILYRQLNTQQPNKTIFSKLIKLLFSCSRHHEASRLILGNKKGLDANGCLHAAFIFSELNNLLKAEEFLNQAVLLAPENIMVRGERLRFALRKRDVILAGQDVNYLSGKVLSDGFRINVASYLSEVGRDDEALQNLEKVTSPNLVQQKAKNMSLILLQNGEKSRAIEIIKEYFDSHVVDVSMLYAWSEVITKEDEASFKKYFDSVDESSLGKAEQSEFYFAKANFFRKRDSENYIKSILKANEIRSKIVTYSASSHKALLASYKIISRSKANIASGVNNKVPEFRPVFIVGMPRSGTTLLAQILSMYTGTETIGESAAFKSALLCNGALFSPTIDNVQAVRKQYTDAMRLQFPKGLPEIIVDKMPGNFQFLRHIFMAFPEAVVLNTYREPMDVCFSCYERNFQSDGMSWTFSQRTIAQYFKIYEQYRRLNQDLNFCNSLEVRYEHLVHDPKRCLEVPLSRLGLTWDPACLKFHERASSVKTASREQVRQKLYKSSVAKWEKYRIYLHDLEAALAESP
jgi:tetratricopeptide (TPR) repeat protein